jgi:hypothetical protein
MHCCNKDCGLRIKSIWTAVTETMTASRAWPVRRGKLLPLVLSLMLQAGCVAEMCVVPRLEFRVVDATTGQPLSGVRLTAWADDVATDRASVISDQNAALMMFDVWGRRTVAVMDPVLGPYTVRLEHAGYVTL